MNSKSIFGLLKQTASEWIEDKAPMLGAAIAYYTVFSLAPLLILGISLAGMFLGPEAARGEIFSQLHGLLGTQTAEAMQDIVKDASEEESPASSVRSSVLSPCSLVPPVSSGSFKPHSIRFGRSSPSRAKASWDSSAPASSHSDSSS